jgi:hypothetical protein
MSVDLRVRNCFFDSAAWAGQGVAGRIGPGGKRQSRRFGFFLFFRIVVAEKAGTSLGVLVLRFGVSRTAVLAEPAVTEIEEVIGLIHKTRGQKSEVRGQKSEVRGQRSEVRGQKSRPGGWTFRH